MGSAAVEDRKLLVVVGVGSLLDGSVQLLVVVAAAVGSLRNPYKHAFLLDVCFRFALHKLVVNKPVLVYHVSYLKKHKLEEKYFRHHHRHFRHLLHRQQRVNHH